jgi:hypothetical protein
MFFWFGDMDEGTDAAWNAWLLRILLKGRARYESWRLCSLRIQAAPLAAPLHLWRHSLC